MRTPMKALRRGALLAVALLLSACSAVESYNEVQALNEAEFVGSPFTRALAREYRDFANRELEDMFDFPDALHFARKGLAAADGEAVGPEPIEDWNLSEQGAAVLAQARARLVRSLDAGGRERAPQLAARAQVSFDCWIEQQEEGWQDDDIAACRQSFEQYIAELETALRPPPVVERVVAPVPVPPPMAPKDAMYLVFFNWNASKLDDGGFTVLDAVAREVAASRPPRLSIVGHTDTSGARSYNQRLGLKRAGAVRDGLVARGVDARMIATRSMGQEDLLVPTPDGVREPANRRTTIAFE